MPLTLVLYSVALWLIFNALGMNTKQFMTTYLATASVVGFAVGFGSQGLVQDVITGLTLIFTDTLEVGDVVEISGYIGRVERVGLRFTELKTFLQPAGVFIEPKHREHRAVSARGCAGVCGRANPRQC